MQCPQNGTLARHGRAQQDPDAPQQVQEQDGLNEKKNEHLAMASLEAMLFA